MARRFVFSLEAVLRQRRAAEEQRQLVVAALERERIGLEERIRGFQRSITSAKEDLRLRLGQERGSGGGGGDGGRAGTVSIPEVKMQANASLHLVARAQQAVIELAGLHRRIDAARLELLRATTARKAVELLRTRRYEEWREENKRKEAAELDEINVTRHGRNEEAA